MSSSTGNASRKPYPTLTQPSTGSAPIRITRGANRLARDAILLHYNRHETAESMFVDGNPVCPPSPSQHPPLLPLPPLKKKKKKKKEEEEEEEEEEEKRRNLFIGSEMKPHSRSLCGGGFRSRSKHTKCLT